MVPCAARSSAIVRELAASPSAICPVMMATASAIRAAVCETEATSFADSVDCLRHAAGIEDQAAVDAVEAFDHRADLVAALGELRHRLRHGVLKAGRVEGRAVASDTRFRQDALPVGDRRVGIHQPQPHRFRRRSDGDRTAPGDIREPHEAVAVGDETQQVDRVVNPRELDHRQARERTRSATRPSSGAMTAMAITNTASNPSRTLSGSIVAKLRAGMRRMASERVRLKVSLYDKQVVNYAYIPMLK